MNDYSSFIGKVLDKRYKIQELVGVGGMACVLRAQDLVMNRTVAIKILNDEYNGNEQAESRFIDESKAVAMLSHKNIVSIYDVAIYPDIKYIVMEYLDGITLREYLDNKGALPWNEACIYILQVLRALEHAHSKDVIHRDIKPQNIILQKNGEIKVMDFGIAKIPTSASATGDKAVGTVYYISPEQASGKETGAFSDLYSVGILLYEAVTGTLPFKAESPMAVAAMQVNDEPQNPRDLVLSIPVGVSQIILKAMAKDPADRFRSAHSMAKAIEWVLRNPDVIFSLSNDVSSTIGDTSVVSIDMIDTAEIKPYGEDEIAQSLGKKAVSDKEMEQQKKKEKELRDSKKKAKKRKKRGGKTMFPVISGIFIPFILVALVVGISLGVTFFKNLFFADDESVPVTFPDLVGKAYSPELVSQLQNGAYGATFQIDEGAVTYSYNPDFKNGEIIHTEPSGNTKKKASVEQGQAVFHFTSIVVNQVQVMETMPDIVGYMRNDAKVLLIGNYGVDASCIEIATETENLGQYLFDDQVTRTSPAAGETYTAGQPIVIYVCSRNQTPSQTAPMPQCVGLDAEYAKRLCGYALYTVEIQEERVIGGDNKITAQSINAGTTSSVNTKVILTVSRPLEGVPNLTGIKLRDAISMLDSLGINYDFQVYGGMYQGEIEPGAYDYDSLMEYLHIAEAYKAELQDDTVVVFQSIPVGEAPPQAPELLLLIGINYAVPNPS